MALALKQGSLQAIRRATQQGSIRVAGNVQNLTEGILSSRATSYHVKACCAQPIACAVNSDHVVTRYFSSQPDRKNSLRIHAVSLREGDYNDDEVLWDDNVPSEKKQTWHVNPVDGTKVEEEEEATWWLYDGTQESRDALADMRAKEARKKRWMNNARPSVRVSEIDERGRAYGRGSRKTAQARVWIQPGEGEVVVNKKEFVTYFPRETDRAHVIGPMVAAQTCGKFDVTAVVQGGGLTGQAGAIRLGLARALEKYDPDFRPPMKRLGMMTRDPRMVERKKVGRVKARKSPQWVRR